jgi:hypothetical protein
MDFFEGRGLALQGCLFRYLLYVFLGILCLPCVG